MSTFDWLDSTETSGTEDRFSLTQIRLILFPGPVDGEHLSLRPSNAEPSWYQHSSVEKAKGRHLKNSNHP